MTKREKTDIKNITVVIYRTAHIFFVVPPVQVEGLVVIRSLGIIVSRSNMSSAYSNN